MTGDLRGYLNEPFRLFHLRDTCAQTFEYHYHEFDKLIFFLSGQVTYLAEGNCYFLQPGDVLLIPHHHIHQPMIDPSVPYERIVLWLNGSFLAENGLADCFTATAQSGYHLLRRDQGIRSGWMRLLQGLEQALSDLEFGHTLLAQTYCLQLLIALNRALPEHADNNTDSACRSDPKIQEIMSFINSNLEQDLSVDVLSRQFYLSRSYLMHRFRTVAGCTIHQYVLQKRLIHAADAIQSGVPVMKAANQCGFQDYSAFLRAFRKAYHVSPRALKESFSTVKGKL